MTDRAALIAEFLARHGWAEAAIKRLPSDASFRRYSRLTAFSGSRAMLMDAPPPKEDVGPFILIARHLGALGYSAPRLIAEDRAAGLLLLEDLGDDTFTRLLAAGADETALYALAIDVLIDLHKRRSAAVPTNLAPYDDDKFLTEAALLVDWYLPEMTGGPTSDAERAEYLAIWSQILPAAHNVPCTLVLRDFHIDNLMRLDRPGIGACGLLDFQDALAGPVTYDVMSLLEDARRDIPPALITSMTARYLAAFPDLDRRAFESSWRILAAQRHAKVIGIFTRLMRRDGKPNYLSHIPRLWRLFEAALNHPDLAPLERWIDRTIPSGKRGVPIP